MTPSALLLCTSSWPMRTQSEHLEDQSHHRFPCRGSPACQDLQQGDTGGRRHWNLEIENIILLAININPPMLSPVVSSPARIESIAMIKGMFESLPQDLTSLAIMVSLSSVRLAKALFRCFSQMSIVSSVRSQAFFHRGFQQCRLHFGRKTTCWFSGPV